MTSGTFELSAKSSQKGENVGKRVLPDPMMTTLEWRAIF
jgi:hypothetical protein